MRNKFKESIANDDVCIMDCMPSELYATLILMVVE